MKTRESSEDSICRIRLDTPAGPIAIQWGNRRLTSVRLGESCAPEGTPPREFLSFMESLRSYLRGERVHFRVRMDLGDVTQFRREVLEECARIPWGETRSYGDLAWGIGNPKASRAVGQAVGRNPIPIVIPCHRVLASGGRIGGFGSGLKWKRFLLGLEGISI